MNSRGRSASRAPWKRTTWALSPAGYTVEVPAGKAPPSPARYARECEVAAAKELHKRGYTVTRSHLSRGRADLVAIGPDTVQVQVKSTWSFTPSFLNAGVREIQQLPATARRECWGYVRGRGHVVTVALSPNGAITVMGQAAYAEQVRAALARTRGQ